MEQGYSVYTTCEVAEGVQYKRIKLGGYESQTLPCVCPGRSESCVGAGASPGAPALLRRQGLGWPAATRILNENSPDE